MIQINIVTIFPPFFEGPLGLSIPSKAAASGSVRYRLVDLREPIRFGIGKFNTDEEID